MIKLLLCSALMQVALIAGQEKITSPIDGRIIGGNQTNILDFPYQVSIEYLGVHQCGGAIIGRTWILTTAHCVKSMYYPEYISIRVGTSYLGLGGTVLNISRAISHANYNSITVDYDISVIQLQWPVPLSRTSQIVALPAGDPIIEGSIATVTGWGSVVEGGVLSTVLRVAEVPIIDNFVCSDVYGSLGYTFTGRMLCAGPWDGSKDACTGDGGGALVYNSRVVGLVSWGSGCAIPHRPGVYTNIVSLREWITEKTGI